MRALASVLISIILAGCTSTAIDPAQPAHLEVYSTTPNLLLCGESGLVLLGDYMLWNAGPGHASNVTIEYEVWKGTTATVLGQSPTPPSLASGRTWEVAALPVDGRNEFTFRASLDPQCSDTAGTTVEYVLRLTATPSTGPTTSDWASISCTWRTLWENQTTCDL
jgi:hypothetical protein